MRGDVVRSRLLDVDVLAGGDRVDRSAGVRVVGRADEHRVDVLAVEDAPVVADDVELEGLARGRHPLIELGLVDLACRDELAVFVSRMSESNTRPPRLPRADDRHAGPGRWRPGARSRRAASRPPTVRAAAEAFKNLRLLSIHYLLLVAERSTS